MSAATSSSRFSTSGTTSLYCHSPGSGRSERDPFPEKAFTFASCATYDVGTHSSGSSTEVEHRPPVDGHDYFKVGETVRVRRWFAARNGFSDWVYGQIVMPVLLNTTVDRMYLVRYTDPRNGQVKEKLFAPALKEIDVLPLKPNKPLLVFALVPPVTHPQIWRPAQVISRTCGHQVGVRVRFMLDDQGEQMTGVLRLAPYNLGVASALKRHGHPVEGTGKE